MKIIWTPMPGSIPPAWSGKLTRESDFQTAGGQSAYSNVEGDGRTVSSDSKIARGIFDDKLRGATMRGEEHFSKNGFYRFVVENNIICHKEATERGIQILGNWLDRNQRKGPIRILDLACGSLPVTIAEIMKHFTEVDFLYGGIDVNPDQVELANDYFEFSKNVVARNIREGDAWILDESVKAQNFDVVFIGLNLHHGTPEELYLLGKQLYALLPEGALIINHDEYRPEEYAYLRRPSVNPDNPAELFILVPPEALQSVPDLGIDEYSISESRPDWRLDMNRKLQTRLADLGANDRELKEHEEHVMSRDYPVSTNDLQKIFTQLGFEVIVHDLKDTEHPLSQYFTVVEIHKPIRTK